ncbi:MAG: hypothetical protein ACRBF0_22595 [Calditrichia bacterium]
MEYTPLKDEKLRNLRKAFGQLIDKRFTHFHTLDLLHEDNNFERCNDLPIILFFEEVDPVSISWSKTEDLAVAFGICLPFGIGGQTTRWVENDVPELKPLLKQKLRGVHLAKEATGELWNRIVLTFDSGLMDVFNAGDENGYQFLATKPDYQLKNVL